ncbi:MAG: zinc ribbon domain-containing protein [Acidobacteriota bacterium]|nr:zinc ribbon domain-containing protein [Acidobacteriota bacterium]
MAITRCPYCRAIIDEKDQFCTNCGTQLLFPEDEAVEEDIPGDRIIDVADEEKDYEIPPPGIEENEEDGDGDSVAENDLEEEVIIIDEIEEAVRRAASDDSDPSVTEKPPVEEPPNEEPPFKDPPIKEPPAKDPPIKEPPNEDAPGIPIDKDPQDEEPSHHRDPELSDHASTASRPLTFDTGELEKSGKTAADLGKLEIDRWLDDRREQDQKKGDTLPPWAGEMKSSRSEEGIADSGIGLPERVTQAALPFGSTPETQPEEDISWKPGEDDEEPSDWAMDREEEFDDSGEWEEPVEDEVAPVPVRSSRMTGFLKSKAFDLFFLAVVWLISAVLAARLMDTSIFRLLPAAPKALLGYYAVLVAMYFFLFQFFLGETLGDRMFRRKNAG